MRDVTQNHIYPEMSTRRCVASNQRLQAQEKPDKGKNRLPDGSAFIFPEYKDVYSTPDAVSGIMILKKAPLPADIIALGVDGINQIWREAKLRGSGLKRAKTLISAAEHSIEAVKPRRQQGLRWHIFWMT